MAGSQRQKQKEETREHILETSMRQFASDGLTVARTSDIAKAAGVSHGTIFAHFPTREILMDAVIEEFGLRVTQKLHASVTGNCGIQDVLEAHLNGIREYEGFYSRLVAESRLLNESSRHSLIMIQSAISFHIVQVAEREMKEGKIKDIPVDLLFNTWIGLIHYYMMNNDLFAPGGSVIEKHGRQLVRHFSHLISA